MKLRSKDLWAALDQVAEECGLTASGLARAAGLDATTFNKSKRLKSDGSERWPSSSSIARVLAVADISFIEFAAKTEFAAAGKLKAPRQPRKAIPLGIDE